MVRWCVCVGDFGCRAAPRDCSFPRGLPSDLLATPPSPAPRLASSLRSSPTARDCPDKSCCSGPAWVYGHVGVWDSTRLRRSLLHPCTTHAPLLDMSEQRRSDRKRTEIQFPRKVPRKSQTKDSLEPARRAHEAAVASAYAHLDGFVQLGEVGCADGGRPRHQVLGVQLPGAW